MLNFVLKFCPTVPSETALMERFASIGVGPGKTFDARALTAEVRQGVEQGMADAWKEFDDFKARRWIPARSRQATCLAPGSF